MNACPQRTLSSLISLLAIAALLPAGTASAQSVQAPAASAFVADTVALASRQAAPPVVAVAAPLPPLGDAFQLGGDRLAAMQNNDGGWDWPLNDGNPDAGSLAATVGPIGQGLAQSYLHAGDPDHLAALTKAGSFLLAKTDTFVVSDGSLAATLDSIFGGTTYRTYVKTNYFDKLETGTYYRHGDPTAYNTQSYIDFIHTDRNSRPGEQNLAAWDIGQGLVSATAAGAAAGEITKWINGLEGEINLLDTGEYKAVLGLAGGVWGLAYAGVDYDPTGGSYESASSTADLGTFLADYQLASGGFTGIEGDTDPGDEKNQETVYAIIALDQLNRLTYLTQVQRAADYLRSQQLVSGGWNFFPGDTSEYNQLTGEALWAISKAYPEVWVCTAGDCGHPGVSFNVIQNGLNGVATGGIVHVLAGSYAENLAINKTLTLTGADQATTIVQPAVSDPNCGGAGGIPLCSGASNLILVQADDVTIQSLTLDGDNPSLSSSYNVGGANIDARNGIITDDGAGSFDNLVVDHVTVKNLYLLGIYDSTGSFDFHDNTVNNVQADATSSWALAASYGPGVFQNNSVSDATEGIYAIHSTGIQFLDNTVADSGDGIRTEQSGDTGGVDDVIDGNTIGDCHSGGSGIAIYVASTSPSVSNNTITNCHYGISAWAQGAAGLTPFTDNTLTGPSAAVGSVGAYITTNKKISASYEDVDVLFTGNHLSGFETGVLLTADEDSGNPGPFVEKTIMAAFHCNQIQSNTHGVDKGTSGTISNDFTYNWWGSATGPNAPDNATGTGNSVVAGINYAPWTSSPTCAAVPPYLTSTTITSDAPDPSYIGKPVTINYKVSNVTGGGPVPVGNVTVKIGSSVICAAAPIDGSGNGSCSHLFATSHVHTLTAYFTPTSSATFLPSSGVASHVVTTSVTFRSQGAYDGWVRESSPTSSKGGTKQSSGVSLQLGDGAGRRQYVAILSFPTSIPAKAVITSVTLKFRKSGRVGPDPFAGLGNLLVDVRKGYFDGYRALQIGDFQAAASKSAVLSFTNTSKNNWYSKSLSAANFGYISRTGTTQFRLRFSKGDNGNNVTDLLLLYTGEASTANRPMLVIEYHLP